MTLRKYWHIELFRLGLWSWDRSFVVIGQCTVELWQHRLLWRRMNLLRTSVFTRFEEMSQFWGRERERERETSPMQDINDSFDLWPLTLSLQEWSCLLTAQHQHWAKGLNTYDHVIFQFFFFNKFAKISTFLFFSVKMGCCVYINEKWNELFWF